MARRDTMSRVAKIVGSRNRNRRAADSSERAPWAPVMMHGGIVRLEMKTRLYDSL